MLLTRAVEKHGYRTRGKVNLLNSTHNVLANGSLMYSV